MNYPVLQSLYIFLKSKQLYFSTNNRGQENKILSLGFALSNDLNK